MSANVDLLASYWTIAVGAVPHGAQEWSSVEFKDRVEAAAKAGFKGMGLWHADLEHTLETRSLKEMKSIFDDNGINHIELEFLLDFWRDDERKIEADKRQKLLLTAAEALGARSVKVGDFFAEQVPMPKLISSFAAVCKDAENHGTKVGFELMPEQFSMIHSVESARALVEGAGAANGGIFFDLWHIVKQKISYDDVARFPLKYIIGVELNDGFLKTMPDLGEETTQYRQLCGEGEFDVNGFVTRMQKAGFKGPWGIEVLNKELRHRPIAEVTQRAYSTTIAQFASEPARAVAR